VAITTGDETLPCFCMGHAAMMPERPTCFSVSMPAAHIARHRTQRLASRDLPDDDPFTRAAISPWLASVIYMYGIPSPITPSIQSLPLDTP
jgi:hypothetical protein